MSYRDDEWKRFLDNEFFNPNLLSDYPRPVKPITFLGKGITPLVDFFEKENGIDVYVLIPSEVEIAREDERAIRIYQNLDHKSNRSLYKGVRISFPNVDYSAVRIRKNNSAIIINLPYKFPPLSSEFQNSC